MNILKKKSEQEKKQENYLKNFLDGNTIITLY